MEKATDRMDGNNLLTTNLIKGSHPTYARNSTGQAKPTKKTDPGLKTDKDPGPKQTLLSPRHTYGPAGLKKKVTQHH